MTQEKMFGERDPVAELKASTETDPPAKTGLDVTIKVLVGLSNEVVEIPVADLGEMRQSEVSANECRETQFKPVARMQLRTDYKELYGTAVI